MAYLVHLANYSSNIGNLNVFEKLLPDEIRRVYFISDVPKNTIRGCHRHHLTWQGLICIAGSCRVYVDNSKEETVFNLDSKSKCLIIKPDDWHFMDQFVENTVLLVIANQYYDINDYIDKPYSDNYLAYLSKI